MGLETMADILRDIADVLEVGEEHEDAPFSLKILCVGLLQAAIDEGVSIGKVEAEQEFERERKHMQAQLAKALGENAGQAKLL